LGSQQTTAELAIGSDFAGYRIEEVAARGGMGVVYRATQLQLTRTVALKLVTPALARDASFRDRFRREWMVAAAIEHPNVIPVYEAGEEDGALYIAMRWVEGTDLREAIDSGPLEPSRAVNLVSQVASSMGRLSGMSSPGGRKCSIFARPATRTHSTPSTVSADFTRTLPEMCCAFSLYPAAAHERTIWSGRIDHCSPTAWGLAVP